MFEWLNPVKKVFLKLYTGLDSPKPQFQSQFMIHDT